MNAFVVMPIRVAINDSGTISYEKLIVPEQWMKLIDLFRDNELEEARDLETLLLKMTGVIMKFGPGGIKAAMDMLGYFGGEPMRPLKPPVPAACKDIQAALETF